jgi:ABC-type multidrug transport system fused ATPase/permease subunit
VLSPIILVLSRIVFKRLTKVDDKRREARKRVLSHVNDGIMGIKTIKTLNLEEKNNKEYQENNTLSKLLKYENFLIEVQNKIKSINKTIKKIDWL